MKRIIWIGLAAMMLLVMSGCAAPQTEQAAIDYGKREHWLALPEKPEKPVDVIYLYPTVWYKIDQQEPNICAIDNATMLAGAELALDKQASVFEPAGNVYAPYYRQVDAVYALTLGEQQHEKLMQGIPTQDVFGALDYYFEHYNEGRPFILAGHSQGSNVLLYVLSTYMKEHPDLYARMVAAYVIGYAVTDEFLTENPHLKFAQSAEDVGVVISYNTEAPVVEGNNPVWLPGANAINPITWTREQTPATAQQNLGSRIDDEKRMNYADATVDAQRGVVICSTVNPEEYYKKGGFPKGVFHGQDYDFYYYDLMENAKLRTERFLNGVGALAEDA